MKTLLLAASMMLASSAWAAAPITPASASATGIYTIDGPDLGILTDGHAPPESTFYQTAAVSWLGQEGVSGVALTLDFGQLYSLTGVFMGVDNNDFYQVQVSADGTQWNTLFTNLAFEGQANSGTELISSVANHIEYQASIDFPSVMARYARIYAVQGDGAYSVSELAFSGVAVVPEPEAWAMLLAGLGLIGAASRRR